MNFEEVDIWARTILGEARGESFQGQVAVAWVIQNRANNPSWWGNTIQEVCLKPRQFSCWDDGDPNKSIVLAANLSQKDYIRALGIALLVSRGDLRDPTDGAVNYHTIIPPRRGIEWPPEWTKRLVETTQVGSHVFYREHE